MAKTSRETASTVHTMDGFDGRYEDLGGYVAGYERYDEDSDPTPLFAGLPDDACQCPHWGVVLRGKLTYRYTDGTVDEIGPGEAYYARPGHTPLFSADTEVVEFSPAAELQATIDVVLANLAALEVTA